MLILHHTSYFIKVLFLFSLSQVVGSFGKIMMRAEKSFLELVPVVFICQGSIIIQLTEKCIADFKKIISSQIIEVGIAHNFFQEIIWFLRISSCHYHSANGFDFFF